MAQVQKKHDETSNDIEVNPKPNWRQAKFRNVGSQTIRYCRLGSGHSRCKVKEERNLCAGNFCPLSKITRHRIHKHWFDDLWQTDVQEIKIHVDIQQLKDNKISQTNKKKRDGKNKLLKSQFPCIPGRCYASSCTGHKTKNSKGCHKETTGFKSKGMRRVEKKRRLLESN